MIDNSAAVKEIHAIQLRKRADALLEHGTLVFEPGKQVAYAFVVPIEYRDDLASIVADIELEEEGA